ncbi:MAG: hypothetical protein PWP24_1001, partial [Clostridiales bacterium]|nr:hypothetical protein [Clostridiales bacterium]
LTFTTYAKRVAKAVTGLKTGTATAVASGQTLKLNATDLVVEDQYSNVMSDSDVKALTNINIAVEGTTITVDNTTMPTAHFVTLTASADTSKTTDIKFGIGIKDNKPNTTDYTAVYTVVDPKTASNLTIKKVNSDHVVKANGVKPTLATTDIEVTGVVAGKTVVIPSTQYVVSGNTGYDLGNTSTPGVTAQTLTGTVEVTVDTKDGAIVLTKDFTFSNAASTITTIEAKEDGKLTAGTLTNAQFAALFTIKDQYGVELTNPTAVKYDVVEMSSNSRVISHNKTNAASVVASKDDKFAVTASYGTITASAEKTVE